MKLYERDPIYRCWRIAAIYRCLIRGYCDAGYALARVREIFPDGTHDMMIDNWMVDAGRLVERLAAERVDADFSRIATAEHRLAA